MSAPFYNAIKGTTSGTPGTGAFTPNAASSGFRPWTQVATGWIGLVRFEDGSAWELSWSYWNGTTLSRAATQMFDSSTGSALSLSSSATAAMVPDAREVSSIIGGNTTRFAIAQVGGAVSSISGFPAITITGSGASATMATTNYLTEQPRIQVTSATTANAQSAVTSSSAIAVVSTTAGHGGWEFSARFGCSQLPTGPRLFVGMTGTTFVANTGEPSALTANVACFAKDSTDTNIQLLVNSNAGTGTKTDTGIPLTANGWYKAMVWNEAGTNAICGLLIRLDTGDIWFGTTSTDTPANGALLFPQVIAGLSATTGTAAILHYGSMMVRAGL